MIPKKTLFETIEAFDRRYKDMVKEYGSETVDVWTLEKFQEWRKMQKAWGKLQDVVEFEIRQFVD